MIMRYNVSETPPWKVQEIFSHRFAETDRALVMLWWFNFLFISFFIFIRVEFTARFLLYPHSKFTRLRRVTPLTAATLAQLDVLSEMVQLMSKPNTSSKRLQANIVNRTQALLSVNLSLSEPEPNQTQVWGFGTWRSTLILASDLLASHSSTQLCRAASPFLCRSCEWCPGGYREAERGSGLSAAPLFTLMVSRCVSDPSTAER